MRVSFKAFGCKVNQYDMQALVGKALAMGFEVVDPASEWDAIVVGSCAVTGRAVAKTRRFVRAALARGRVVVMGCAPRLDDGWMKAEPGVMAAPRPSEALEALCAIAGMPAPAAWDGCGISRFHGQKRAFLKVGDGCPGGCTYCVIPILRGPVESRPAGDVVGEARRLAEAGHAEIVLTAIRLGMYGADLSPPSSLEAIVRELDRAPEIGRIRLSSIEIMEVTPGLLDAVASGGKIARHLHLPLQSGDAGVLRRMGRRYGPAEYMGVLGAAREAVPGLSVSTDVIEGFPGEDEAAFGNTAAFVAAAGFSRIHVFPFSPRPGTAAWEWRRDPAVKEGPARAARIARIGAASAEEFRRGFAGRTVEVLAERASDRDGVTVLRGHTSEYLEAEFPGSRAQLGTLVRVTVESGVSGILRGVPAVGGESARGA